MSHTTVGSPVLPSANPNPSPRDTIVLRRRGRKPKVLVALAKPSTTNTTNGQQQSSGKFSINPMSNQESPALPSPTPIVSLSPELVDTFQSMREPLREVATEIIKRFHQEKIYTVMNRYEIGSLVALILRNRELYGEDAIYKLSKVLQLGEKGPTYLYRLATFATYFDRKTVEDYSRRVMPSGKTLTLSHWFLLCAIKEVKMRQNLLEKAVNEGLSTSDLRFQIKSLLPASSSSVPATIETEEGEELGQEEYADTEEVVGDSGSDFSPEEGEEESGAGEREGTDQSAAVSAAPKKRGRKKKEQQSSSFVGAINKPKVATKGSRGRKVSVPSDPLTALQKFLDSSERLGKYFGILNNAIDRIQANLQDEDNTLTPEQKSILKEKLTEVIQNLERLIDNADYCLPKVSSILNNYLGCSSFSPNNEAEEELMRVSGRGGAAEEDE